jgi:hypothetical protein
MNFRLHKKGRKLTMNEPDDKGEFAAAIRRQSTCGLPKPP